MTNINIDFFNHLFILLSLMIAFTCFKVANCHPFTDEGEEFDWKKLFIGTAKHLIVIAGSVVVFMAGSLFGKDLLLIKLGETEVTLQAAIDLTTLAILAFYSTKYIKNLAEFAGLGNHINSKLSNVNSVNSSLGGSLTTDFNLPSDNSIEGRG